MATKKTSCHDKAAKKGGVLESFFGMNWPIYLDLHKILGTSKTYYPKWRFYHGTSKESLETNPSTIYSIPIFGSTAKTEDRIDFLRSFKGFACGFNLHIFHLKSADAPKNIPLPKNLTVSFREGKHLQRSSYYREIPQNYHTFALFGSPHKWVGKHLPIKVHLCCCNALLHIQVRGGPSGVWGKQDATYPNVHPPGNQALLRA